MPTECDRIVKRKRDRSIIHLHAIHPSVPDSEQSLTPIPMLSLLDWDKAVIRAN